GIPTYDDGVIDVTIVEASKMTDLGFIGEDLVDGRGQHEHNDRGGDSHLPSMETSDRVLLKKETERK
ncbi:hypothetical protein Ancab_004602, partial [Ancistrocladus abbreviatus]